MAKKIKDTTITGTTPTGETAVTRTVLPTVEMETDAEEEHPFSSVTVTV